MSKRHGEDQTERLLDDIRKHEMWATRSPESVERAIRVYKVVSGLGPTDSMTLPKVTELVAGLSQREADPTAQEMVKAKIPMLTKDAHYRVSEEGEISFTPQGVNVLLCIGAFGTSEEFVYRDLLVLIPQITMDGIMHSIKRRA